MLPTQRRIDGLSSRIEIAYGLRRPEWRRGCSTPRVWQEAAYHLWRVHRDDPERIPLDPEFYVATQPVSSAFSDPWSELAGSAAARRYRNQVHRLVRCLRQELKGEVKAAERLLEESSDDPGRLANDPRLSPLGCYIAALRRGRPEIAARFARGAFGQHESCPLYRVAALGMIPGDLYPVELAASGRTSEITPRVDQALLSLN